MVKCALFLRASSRERVQSVVVMRAVEGNQHILRLWRFAGQSLACKARNGKSAKGNQTGEGKSHENKAPGRGK